MVDLFSPVSRTKHIFNSGAQIVSGVLEFGNSGGTLSLPRHSSNPTTWADGQSLIGGELIFRTDLNAVRVYNGSAWGALGGVSAHSGLTGLTADDHNPIYMFYRPTVVRENKITIQNPAAFGLIIAAHASQLESLQVWTDSGLTQFAKLDKDFKMWAAGFDAGSQEITTVADPTATDSAATKNYVDTLFIDTLPTETSIASGDYVVIYDVSAGTQKKMTRANFTSGLSGGGGGGNNYFPGGWA